MPDLLIDLYSTPKDAPWAPVALPVGMTITSDLPDGTLSDHGLLRVVDGVLYYRPDEDYVGTDSFSITAVDATDTYTVTVEIEISGAEAQPQTFYDDRITPEIPTSDQSIVLTPVAEFERIGGANQRFNSFDYSPDGRFFAGTDGRADGEGRIYELTPNGDGTFDTALWFEPGPAIFAATGLQIDNSNFIFGGLRGIAFHPDFETNGKFYVSMMQQIPDSPTGHSYIGPIYDQGQNGDSVVAEFTVDLDTGDVIETSYREVFRVSVPVDDHPIRQIEFNEFAEPGDEDYGLLYVAHGDGSIQSATSGGGLRNDALGKILRVDPLQSGSDPYSVPDTNPFVDTTEMPDEVYAIGFRNPHTLAFSLDADGEAHLFVADVGRDNAEEINLVVSGGNYGWSAIEGIFSLNRTAGTLVGVEPLTPEDTAYAIAEEVIFPASFIGHFGFVEFDSDGNPVDGQVGGGQAIASGHAISTESTLQGSFIFGDFAKGGRFYEADLDALLDVNSTIPEGGDIGDVDWVTPAHMTLLFDHDGDPDTTPQLFSNILPAIGRTRSDIRFNQGPDGEMYITTKRDGMVYKVANADPDFADTVIGTAGDDDLFAFGGDDRLLGDLGDDTIRFSAGEDTATGGLGADLFVFSTAGGIDTVTDYRSAVDRLDLSAWTSQGIAVTERVAGDDIELVRGDTGAVIGRLLGAALTANQGPVATPDRFDVLQSDLAAAGAAGVAVPGPGVLGNDGDPDSDTVTLSAVAGSAANIGQWIPGDDGGLIRILADGRVQFADPDGALSVGNTTEITYSITDGDGASDTARLVIRIDEQDRVNTAPVAVDDSFVVTQGIAGSFTRLGALADNSDILFNDSDPDGDPLSIIAINDNGFDVSTVGSNIWFAGSNGGEFRVFDTGVVDFRFSADEFQAGATTGFDYTVVDGNDASDFGAVSVRFGGFANDDLYAIPADVFADADSGLIILGRINDDTDALENDVAGARIVSVDGSAAGLGAWVAGSDGGEFRVFDSGVVQFRNQGIALDFGETTFVEYRIAAPGASGDTLTARIEVAVEPSPEIAVDDIYSIWADDLASAGSSWFRLGAFDDNSDMLGNDAGVLEVTEVNGAAIDQGVWFAGSNGGEFRVYDTGVVDFRNQGDILQPGEMTGFSYRGVTGDGTEDVADVVLAVSDLVLT